MANTLQLKRKTNATGSPTAGNLAEGELAINTVDKKLFFKDSSNNVQEIKDSTTQTEEALANSVAMAVALG